MNKFLSNIKKIVNRKSLIIIRRVGKKLLIATLASVLVGASLAYLLLKPQTASAAWFDDSWAYRTSLTITHDASDSNKKVKFDIDTATLISAGKMQSDCGDSRFTDVNGNLLRYYIDETNGACNSASTDYYILLPTINNGTTVIYHYYGNPSADNGTELAQFSEATLTPSGGISAGSEEKGPGPVAYWKFDDAQGITAQDSTTNNYDSTISGATWRTEDMCVSGKCLKFDGIDDYVDTNRNIINGSGPFTIELWVKTNSLSSFQGLVSEFGSDDIVGQYRVVMNTSGKLLFMRRYNTSTNREILKTSSTALTANTWYHLAFVYGGSSNNDLHIYINGIKDITTETDAGSSDPPNLRETWIGRDAYDNYFDGFIDNVKIYNYARSTDQIKSDFASRGTNRGAGVVLGSASDKFLSDGIVGYWKMDESPWTNDCSTASVIDSSGNGKNGVSCPSSTGVSTLSSGKFGGAPDLDGSNDYIRIDSPTLPTGDFTYAVWIFPDAVNDEMIVMSSDGNGANEIGAYLNNGKVDIYLNGSVIISSNTTITSSSWNHIALTQSGPTVSLYINGVLDKTTTNSTTLDFSTCPLFVGTAAGSGCSSNLANYFNGRIDELRIYNRAFTNNEISTLYNYAPGPAAYWNFEEATGTTVNDVSGNSNTGTLQNGPLWTPGKFGGGLQFDGVDDTVNAGANVPVQNDITVEAWIKPASINSGTMTIAANSSNGASQDFTLEINRTAGKISTVWGDSIILTSNTTLSANKWYHVALVRSGSNGSWTAKIYINGVLDANTTTSTNPNGDVTPVFCIGALHARNGCNSAGDLQYEGVIDELRVYNYPRTDKQIIEDMNAGHPAVGTPVGSAVGHWKLDEGYGITANDSSPNDNDLTLSTSAWTNNGKFGKAWNGNGTRWLSRADDSDFDFASSDDFSITLWFRSDSATNPASTEYIIAKGPTSASGYALYANTSGNICFGIDDDTSSFPEDSVCSTTDIYDNTWHQIIATKTGTSRIDLYIDGKLSASDTSLSATGTLANSSTLYVGDLNGADDGDEFNGDLDEIKIYRFALSASEVEIEFNRGSAQVLGTLGNNTSAGSVQAASQEYCIPGDTSPCPSPVGEWKFDHERGTTGSNAVKDTSGNGNHGTMSSSMKADDWVPGKFGTAMRFDTIGDVVNVGDPANGSLDVGTEDFTITAWVKIRSGTSQIPTIVNKGADQTGDPGYWFRFDTVDGKLELKTEDSDTADSRCQYESDETFNIADNKWHFVAVVLNREVTADTAYFYLDGRFVGSESCTLDVNASFDSDEDFQIGDNSGGQSTMDGLIDQLRIYGDDRTSAQIAWEYNRGAPVAHWKFDECQGTTAYDSSENSLSGNLTPGSSGATSVGNCTTIGTTMWYNGRNGKYNYSVDLDGTDDYIDVADNSKIDFTSRQDFTVALWVKTTQGMTLNTWPMIINKQKSSSPRQGYEIFLHNSNIDSLWHVAIWINGTGYGVGGRSNIADGNWHHIVFMREGSTIRTYEDGKLANTAAASNGDLSNAFPLRIGRRSDDGSYPFDGQIDDARVYNYALTADQVKLLYNDGVIRFGPSEGSP